MTLEYPVEYKDRRGTEHSKFVTDGESMKIQLRGIVFVGHFWELTPIPDQLENAKDLFDLNESGELSGIIDCNDGTNLPGYSLKVKMPIKIITKEDYEIDAEIHFSINPFKSEFVINGNPYSFEVPNFEYGLSQEHTSSLNFKHVKCCVNCRYSDFSPANEEYGGLMCFKNSKEAWEKIGYRVSKENDNWKKIKNRLFTQEAFWCEEFKIKIGKASI